MGEPLLTFTAGEEALASEINSNFKTARNSVVELIAGEAINTTSVPKPFYIGADGKAYLCDANDQTKLDFAGFVQLGQNVSAGSFVTVITGDGIMVKGFSGLTVGSKYYVQDAVGTIGTTVGTYEVLTGYAVSASDILMVKGSFEYMGSANDSGDVITVPAGARFAIVMMTFSGNSQGTGIGSVLLSKYGCLTLTISVPGFDGTYQQTGIATWDVANNHIDLTMSGATTTISGTAYFYR